MDETLDIEEFGKVETYKLVKVVALAGQVVVHKDAQEVSEIIISVKTNPGQIFV